MIDPKIILLPTLLWITPAAAQVPEPPIVYIMPEIPDEATKRAALLKAYQLNGNSMVRCCSSIDLSHEFATVFPGEPIPPPVPVPLPKTDKVRK